MEEGDLLTPVKGENAECNYAGLYYNNEYCQFEPKDDEEDKIELPQKNAELKAESEWVSPSDLLLGKVELSIPCTSKITRAITHKGILEIGDEVLDKEYAKFLKYLNELLADNNAAWSQIQQQEKLNVRKKVQAIYENIFQRKSDIMQREMEKFYEKTLYELEDHLRNEVQTILMHAHCSMIKDLNKEINEKLAHEKRILLVTLKKQYNNEIKKLNKYYYLLLNNEKHRSERLVNQALEERNKALKSFCNQIEMETCTGTMYVMCAERRKCKMRNYLLESYHTKEIENKLKTIKEKQEILDQFETKKKQILDINRDWQEKVKKILQLFLKFISFSLKLLPEQTTFLLDLEKLVVLQLNEIQKSPTNAKSIVVQQDNLLNLFEFNKEQSKSPCEREPFTIEGDLSPSVSTQYGSRETIPFGKELKYFRLQRQFLYAKCQKLDEVRAYLESRRCKCEDYMKPRELKSSEETIQKSEASPRSEPTPTPVSSESSLELFLVDDIKRLHQCPLRSCQNMTNTLSFPDLEEYFDFSEEKFKRVQAILGPEPVMLQSPPITTSPKIIIRGQLPFAETKEPYHDVGTQYSSQEELLTVVDFPCSCVGDDKEDKKFSQSKEPDARVLNVSAILEKRRFVLRKILQENPKLLKLFTDESFDFVM